MAEILIGNIRGGKGDPGAGLKILDYYATFEALSSAVTNPSAGDAYGVGDAYPYDIYVYSETHGWVNNGSLQPDINEQTPNYADATTLETLASGEKISLAFGKIKKAISDFILHLADTTKHVTSSDRTSWNGKAPGGHGLGDRGGVNQKTSFLDLVRKGCGFYIVGDADDTPYHSGEWLSALQLSRQLGEGVETGTQMAFSEWSSVPKMWLRTIMTGTPTSWYEVLHTGNLSRLNIPRIEVQNYEGNGLYGFENARQFTFSFQPKIFFISGYGRGGGNYTLTVPYGFPFAHTVAHTSDGGFASMNCEFRYSGNTITMYNTTSANNGFNTEGKPYTIVAIG